MPESRFVLTAAIAATAALAACNSEPEIVAVNRYDAQAEALKNAAPVAPPPMMVANRAYRCSDNSLYFVDFFNNHTATVRTSQDGIPEMLRQAAPDAPYTGEGYSVSGSGETVTINGKSCHT